MFDLNGKDFQETTIFNDGKAGIAKNVTISVTKRQPGEPESNSPYKLIVRDKNGGLLTGWFNYPNAREGNSEEQNINAAKRDVSRVLHIARAVVGSSYKFPDTTGMSPSKIIDVLFNIISENAGDSKFNVYVNYGTKDYPNKKGYLGLRYFNFIEKTSEDGSSKLRDGANDLLVRIVADVDNAPKSDLDGLGDTIPTSSETDWTKL